MADETLTEGDYLSIKHETTNRGDSAATADIKLLVDGSQADIDSSVEIAPGATYRGILAWITESGDAQGADYTVEVVAEDRSDSITANVS
jgi:hypothetical protein